MTFESRPPPPVFVNSLQKYLLALVLALLPVSTALSDPRHCADNNLGLPSVEQVDDNAQIVRLGEKLFFDSRLSTNGQVSCSSCHNPDRAFSDGQPVAVGIRGHVGTRNTPSILNVAFESELFWDGRVKTLEEQALLPLLNPFEHGLASPYDVVKIIASDPAYRSEFSAAFRVSPDNITTVHVSAAISAFERSLVAGNSPIDLHLFGTDTKRVEGSRATDSAIRGLALFRGKAGCITCHPIERSHALFTDHRYHESPLGISRRLLGRLREVTDRLILLRKEGRNEEIANLLTTDKDTADLGRFVYTLDPIDIGKFKTPSLRNVALTAPYMHDGSVSSLEKAVSLELYSRGTSLRYPIVLTNDEKKDLVSFLTALTSPTASCQSR